MENKEVQKVEVPVGLLQEVINYLGTRPLQESYNLFNAIAPYATVSEEQPKSKEDKAEERKKLRKGKVVKKDEGDTEV